MKDNSFLKKHHAFLIISDDGGGFLDKFLENNLNFKISESLDYWRKEVETFGIKDSRELKEAHFKKPFKENGEKIFVVKTKRITFEAQNALLKILEDPQPKSRFFFVISSKSNLIPTLLSRFFVLEELDPTDSVEKVELGFEMRDFLKLDLGERLKTLSKIVSSKDKNLALEFLNELEKNLKEGVDWHSVRKEEVDIFEILAQSRDYLKSPSASIKMILENIALNLPQK